MQKSSSIKDPSYYSTLGQEETFFGINDPREHRLRWNVVATMFASQYFDVCLPMIKSHVRVSS